MRSSQNRRSKKSALWLRVRMPPGWLHKMHLKRVNGRTLALPLIPAATTPHTLARVPRGPPRHRRRRRRAAPCFLRASPSARRPARAGAATAKAEPGRRWTDGDSVIFRGHVCLDAPRRSSSSRPNTSSYDAPRPWPYSEGSFPSARARRARGLGRETRRSAAPDLGAICWGAVCRERGKGKKEGQT